MSLNKLEKNIKLKKSTLITGQKGTGKTWLMKQTRGIYIDYPSAKIILSAIIKHYNLSCFRWATIPEQISLVEKYLPETVLLIDNCESLYKPTIRFLETLSEKKATIVCASEKRISFCREKIVLGQFSLRKSFLLAKRLMIFSNLDAARIISHKSLGNPGKIVEMVRDYELAITFNELDPRNNEKVVQFFLKIKPQMPSRIDLFPVWLLFVLGFGLLLLKTIFFSSGSFRDGYLVASFGYLSLIIYRMMPNNAKVKK